VRRSATPRPAGSARTYTGTVAKPIDTTKCIGCKACQVASMEWNDLRDENRQNAASMTNPGDLSGDPGR